MNDEGFKVFVTFNPNSEVEERTALRLQTIANLYGVEVLLPYRRISNKLSSETKNRIDRSRIVIAFSGSKLTSHLKQELIYAKSQNKTIVVIYNTSIGKNLIFKDYEKVQEFYLDYDNTDRTLHEIAQFLRDKADNLKRGKSKPNSAATRGSRKKVQATESGALTALLSIGLGLLAFWALSKALKDDK